MTPQERAAVKAWRDLGTQLEEAMTWTGNPFEHPGLQELETAAWLANAAFRAADLLDAPVERIRALDAEDAAERLAAQH